LSKPIDPPPPIDADLAQILDAWPHLPEPIRRAMLALIGTAVQPKGVPPGFATQPAQ
jgi:hypothetical protein